MTARHPSSALREINFDGIVGPTHGYAGLSRGNLAATSHAGEPSRPRAAALQGLAKMRACLGLGLAQGVFVPLPRPNRAFLAALGEPDDAGLVAAAWSASAMWAANAATVSPAPDTADRRCHLTVANLATMPHRAHEALDTARQLAAAFADRTQFALHGPVPAGFGDEGAANHMRLAPRHGEPGLEIFVHGRASSGGFPARQHEQASRAVARLHRLDPARVLCVEQSAAAIAAGAFHNDVVAVANEHVLIAHERAFADPAGTFAAIAERCPAADLVIVRESEVSLAEAVRSYLFNAQLVTVPDGTMALIVPREAWQGAASRAWLDRLVAGGGPVRRVFPVDLGQSMANGGGPACLRLRVVCDPAAVDPRFLLDDARAERIEAVVARCWPEQIDPGDLARASLADEVAAARLALLAALGLDELA